jgi:uncharacterized OsmC-like protein
MTTATAEQTTTLINGSDTARIMELATNMSQDENFGQFQFRARNNWIHGSRSRTSIQGFYAGGKENMDRKHALTVDADQPVYLAGKNTAPNAVEYVLHALTSCLNTTIVAHASVRGILLDELIITAEGDMDARGFFGVSDEVNRGYNRVRVNIEVKSDADQDTIEALAMYSPVYEMVARAVPVELNIIKIHD